jgi:two-component SAPR family response regulator
MSEKTGAKPRASIQPKVGTTLHVYGFGRAEVFHDSQLVSKTDWESNSTKELFYYFMTTPQGVRKEQIMDALWPDASPGRANSSFHTANYRLRRALFPECVIYEDGWYMLNPDVNYWYDVEEFEKLIEQAMLAEPDSEAMAGYLREALSLYRGDFIEESYLDWCSLKREMLREKYIEALVRLGDFHAARAQYAESIELYRQVLARDNYREDIHRKIMFCHIRTGDRASAVKQYQQCVEILDEELGLKPMAETSALYEEIVHEDGEIGEEVVIPEGTEDIEMA